MSKLTLPRLKNCACGRIAVSRDEKCIIHTRFKNSSTSAEYTKYPTPERLGIVGPAMGVEIECYPRSSNVECIPDVDYWCMDGSLDNNGREIKICDKPDKIAKKACGIIHRIKASGGYIDRDCGLHVHMSHNINCNQNYDAYYIMRNKVNHLMTSLENSLWSLFRDRSRAYVNSWLITKSTTFENRAHPATLNPHIMVAWIDVCKKLQEAINNNSKLYNNWCESRDFMFPFRKNSYAYRYLKARKDNDGRMRDDRFTLV